MLHDIQFGWRLMWRERALFTFVILTLALGIASLTAVVTVVHDVLIEPLPYPRAQELVSIQSTHPELGDNYLSRVETFNAFREEAASLERIAAVETGNLQLQTGRGARRLQVLLATPSLFEMLGARAVAGRLFSGQEGSYRHGRVAVLSDRLWQEGFGGDPAVVGRSFRFAGDRVLGTAAGQLGTFTVVGVLEPGFQAPFGNYEPHLWIADSFDRFRVSAATHLMAFGRLRDGTGLAAAEKELGDIYARLQRATGSADSQWTTKLVPLREALVGEVRRPIELLLIGALLLFVVAAANTVGLLATRADARASEVALRSVLGADRRRLIRQMAGESLPPVLLAGSLGLLGGALLIELYDRLGGRVLPSRFEIAVDPGAVSVIAAVTLAVYSVFALVPVARFSAANLTRAMKGRTGGRSRRARLGALGLVGFQVAMALVLIVASTLLAGSLLRLTRVDLGFDPQGLLTARLSLSDAHHPDSASRRSFYERLLGELRAMPEVQEAGLVNLLPLAGESAATEVVVERPRSDLPDDPLQLQLRTVSPGYLEAMGIPLLAGELFDQRDLTRPSVIVSAEAAQLLWGGRNPVGERLKAGSRDSPAPWSVVRGVVGDVRHDSVDGDTQPTLYLPLTSFAEMSVVLRTRDASADRLAAELRRRVAAVDPAQPVDRVEAMSARLDTALGRWRLSAWTMGLMAGMTLLLATIGVYATTWRSVVEGRHEIGVRYAFGADRPDVVRLLLRRIAPWVIGGVVGGACAATAVARFLSSLLFELDPLEASIFAATTLLVAAVAFLAVFLPSRRGARIDPAEILRS